MTDNPDNQDSNENGGTDREQTLLEHLLELRTRLVRAVLAVGVATIALLPFSQEIYTFMAEPMMRHMPEGSGMIAIDVTTPFLTPFKLTLLCGLVLAIPVVIYQIWAFVAPGLYDKEKHLAKPLLISATLLFYLGCAFAYYVVFPVAFDFFQRMAPEGVNVSTDIRSYLQFITALFFAFGIAFELPIAIIILVALGVTTPDKLATKRPFIFVGAFAIGMLLTPPDVISQTLLAIPMWMLFEFGLVLSRFLVTKRREEEQEAEAES